jgi:hypothetical protein
MIMCCPDEIGERKQGALIHHITKVWLSKRSFGQPLLMDNQGMSK